jgi:hypothetical protein
MCRLLRYGVAVAFVVLVPAWLLALTLVPISLGAGIAIARDPVLGREALDLLSRALTPPDD